MYRWGPHPRASNLNKCRRAYTTEILIGRLDLQSRVSRAPGDRQAPGPLLGGLNLEVAEDGTLQPHSEGRPHSTEKINSVGPSCRLPVLGTLSKNIPEYKMNKVLNSVGSQTSRLGPASSSVESLTSLPTGSLSAPPALKLIVHLTGKPMLPLLEIN